MKSTDDDHAFTDRFANMFDRKKRLCFMNLWLPRAAAGLAIANWRVWLTLT